MTIQGSTTADNMSTATICTSAIACAKSVNAIFGVSAKRDCAMNAKSVYSVSVAPQRNMNSTMAITTGTRDGKKDKSAAGAVEMCLRGKRRNPDQ